MKSIFHPQSNTKSIPMPRHKNRLGFDPETEKGHFRPLTHQPSQFHPYTEIKSSYIAYTEMKSIVTTHTNAKSISMLTLKPSDLQPGYNANQLRPPAPKPTQAIPTLHSSYFLPPHQNQVNFDPRTRSKKISIPTLKPSQFRSPRQQPS